LIAFDSHSKMKNRNRIAGAEDAPQSCGPEEGEKAVIQRLRNSQKQWELEQSEAGARDGREWAETIAEAIQLRHLAETDDPRGDWYRLFSIIEPDSDGDRGAACEFWERMSGSPVTPEDSYVQGFASGALEVWDGVKDEL
jgi:hypothetical protein